MNNVISVGAMAALMHNGSLINKAEKILQEAVESENTWVWVELSNGSMIKLEPGFKIRSVEVAYCGKGEVRA